MASNLKFRYVENKDNLSFDGIDYDGYVLFDLDTKTLGFNINGSVYWVSAENVELADKATQAEKATLANGALNLVDSKNQIIKTVPLSSFEINSGIIDKINLNGENKLNPELLSNYDQILTKENDEVAYGQITTFEIVNNEIKISNAYQDRIPCIYTIDKILTSAKNKKDDNYYFEIASEFNDKEVNKNCIVFWLDGILEPVVLNPFEKQEKGIYVETIQLIDGKWINSTNNTQYQEIQLQETLGFDASRAGISFEIAPTAEVVLTGISHLPKDYIEIYNEVLFDGHCYFFEENKVRIYTNKILTDEESFKLSCCNFVVKRYETENDEFSIESNRKYKPFAHTPWSQNNIDSAYQVGDILVTTRNLKNNDRWHLCDGSWLNPQIYNKLNSYLNFDKEMTHLGELELPLANIYDVVGNDEWIILVGIGSNWNGTNTAPITIAYAKINQGQLINNWETKKLAAVGSNMVDSTLHDYVPDGFNMDGKGLVAKYIDNTFIIAFIDQQYTEYNSANLYSYCFTDPSSNMESWNVVSKNSLIYHKDSSDSLSCHNYLFDITKRNNVFLLSLVCSSEIEGISGPRHKPHLFYTTLDNNGQQITSLNFVRFEKLNWNNEGFDIIYICNNNTILALKDKKLCTLSLDELKQSTLELTQSDLLDLTEIVEGSIYNIIEYNNQNLIFSWSNSIIYSYIYNDDGDIKLKSSLDIKDPIKQFTNIYVNNSKLLILYVPDNNKSFSDLYNLTHMHILSLVSTDMELIEFEKQYWNVDFFNGQAKHYTQSDYGISSISQNHIIIEIDDEKYKIAHGTTSNKFTNIFYNQRCSIPNLMNNFMNSQAKPYIKIKGAN